MLSHSLLRLWTFVLLALVSAVAAKANISPVRDDFRAAIVPRAFTVSTAQQCTTIYCGSKPKSVLRTTVTVRKTAKATVTRTRAQTTITVKHPSSTWTTTISSGYTTITRTSSTIEVFATSTTTVTVTREQISHVGTTVTTISTHRITPANRVIPRPSSYTHVLGDPDNAANKFPNKKRDALAELVPKAGKFAKSVRCTKTLNSRTTSTTWKTTGTVTSTTISLATSRRLAGTIVREITASDASTVTITLRPTSTVWAETIISTSTYTIFSYTGTVTTTLPVYTHYAACDRPNIAPNYADSEYWVAIPGPIPESWTTNGWVVRHEQRVASETRCCDMCHALGNQCNGMSWVYTGNWGPPGPPGCGPNCSWGPEPEIRGVCTLYMAGSNPTCRAARWEKYIEFWERPQLIANGPACKMWKRRMPGVPL